jgi:hypothetical protein
MSLAAAVLAGAGLASAAAMGGKLRGQQLLFDEMCHVRFSFLPESG